METSIVAILSAVFGFVLALTKAMLGSAASSAIPPCASKINEISETQKRMEPVINEQLRRLQDMIYMQKQTLHVMEKIIDKLDDLRLKIKE